MAASRRSQQRLHVRWREAQRRVEEPGPELGCRKRSVVVMSHRGPIGRYDSQGQRTLGHNRRKERGTRFFSKKHETE
jgi:hypothetical protein